jgi:hypothetical protein
MRIGHLLIVMLLASMSAPAQDSTPERLAPCKFPVTRQSQESTFTVVFTFEVKHGRPVAIRRVLNDFLPDADFESCISAWKLPALPGKVTAAFSYKTAEGWTEMAVSGKDFVRQIPLGK